MNHTEKIAYKGVIAAVQPVRSTKQPSMGTVTVAGSVHAQAHEYALHDIIFAMNPDKIMNNFRHMQSDIEHYFPFDTPKNLLTSMPLKYPPNEAFEARLQLLHATSSQVKYMDKNFSLSQLLFVHDQDFVIPAIYIREEDALPDWMPMVFRIFTVSFATARSFELTPNPEPRTFTTLLVNHMTEWWAIFHPFGRRLPYDADVLHDAELDAPYPKRQYRHKPLVIDATLNSDDMTHFHASVGTSLMSEKWFNDYIQMQSTRWRNCVATSPEVDDAFHGRARLEAEDDLTRLAVAHQVQQNPSVAQAVDTHNIDRFSQYMQSHATGTRLSKYQNAYW